MTQVWREFVVQFKDGSRAGRPVVAVREDETTIYVYNGLYEYEYTKSDIDKWTVRPYTPNTTYDAI